MDLEDEYHQRMREIMSTYYWEGGGKIRKQQISDNHRDFRPKYQRMWSLFREISDKSS